MLQGRFPSDSILIFAPWVRWAAVVSEPQEFLPHLGSRFLAGGECSPDTDWPRTQLTVGLRSEVGFSRLLAGWNPELVDLALATAQTGQLPAAPHNNKKCGVVHSKDFHFHTNHTKNFHNNFVLLEKHGSKISLSFESRCYTFSARRIWYLSFHQADCENWGF